MSTSYIEVIYHPHSGNTTSTMIPIDISNQDQSRLPRGARKFNYICEAKPWAPFRKRADFEFARTVIMKALDRETVEILIEGFHGRWASGSQISFLTFKDFQKSLEAARNFGFQSGEVKHMFKGKLCVFKFEYRDPWKWLLDIVTDTTLSESIMWYPVEKYLHQNGRICRIYDELNTGTRWWDIQDSLPQEVGVPHCFLPLHLWLDKSNVAKTVKKHPIILRPGFLPSVIRNASGNGGGVLIGYMSIVEDPNETAETEDDSASSIEIAEFKREIYHKILHIILRTIRRRSRAGEAVICGDHIMRVLHPGFLIHAVDGEEAYCLCGTRGVRANYPCPRCLVHKSCLDKLSIPLTMRTQNKMQEIYTKALTLRDSAAEKLLKDAGLHFVKNAFWSIYNSDPYLAYSYDMLHAFDSGEWGKHQWPLLLDHILNASEKRWLSSNMRLVPRWRSLKHFNAVTSVDFADGNSYRDILKRLGKDYNKNYNYPKHHFLKHLPFDLRSKASTDNYTTRPGEGFQQEVQQAFDQTNFRDTEPQMTRIDENQEAIARITMAVEQYDSSKVILNQEETENDGEEAPPPVVEGNHWKLGSPLPRVSAREWEISEGANPAFRHFESKLIAFLVEVLAEDDRPPQPILINRYQCIYLRYRSLENWEEKQDILRCNPDFYNKPRHDCIVINTDPISFGRIYALFSCQSPSKTRHDIALIGKFQATKWKPKTRWDGCKVFEEKGYDFVLIKYFIRGCHMVPAFENSGKVYYLNDLVDGDAFLLFFLEERLSQSEL
ncbi:hypothetical protein M422DRAFT_162395 [Sphaerobolus stellatus SS14]|nr:hypothetical protein M422DRAFT_162395 [Sphaerobolus stellatus SS14]